MGRARAKTETAAAVAATGDASASGASPTRRGAGRGSGTPAAAATTTTGITTGASLTLDELCVAAGMTADEVKGLESFGLIESTNEAGIETFDEDALSVAKLAASFRSFGVEPRHLRLYRNAVDREVGLIEQVVIPLLRLRNPESRQRAVESAEELAALGQSMRATLLRASLRRHLGG